MDRWQKDCVQSGFKKSACLVTDRFRALSRFKWGDVERHLHLRMQKRVKVELILQWVNHVFSSPSAPIPGATSVATHKSKESTTTKDVREDVIHPRAATATFPQALFSISIIKFLLFRVAQHLIGKTDFFKLLRDIKEKRRFNFSCSWRGLKTYRLQQGLTEIIQPIQIRLQCLATRVMLNCKKEH